MALIIDANRSCDFSKPVSTHATEILSRIRNRRLRTTVGGHLLKELSRTKMITLITEWGRAGILNRVNDTVVNCETECFEQKNIESDDPHVLALVSISKTRLVFTEDANLILDLKNSNLVSPRGKIVKPNTRSRVANSLFERFGK